MIKAVVFDFDGLILDTESVWYECYKEVLERFNVELPLEVFAQIIGTHDEAFHQYMVEQLKGSEHIEAIKTAASTLHREKMTDLVLREGVKDFLEEAKELNLRIGLATSSHKGWVMPFLEKYGVIDYFDTIQTSDNVTNIKPDPELYLKAIEALDVQPTEAIAFEDSINGSMAAKKAGMTCVIVPNPVTKDLNFQDFDMRIETMGGQSLKKIIEDLATTNDN
ncbi:HAD family hydrolase [Lederbergia sp. NSJ-179]|uniref:HAD family hydrolase n=1 Tax=Lederbergia sp. NSJ-179 TaxID=2931402 RepID=UPI001FCFCE84|nr:HAD family hydrolase [Lederbergia sp. NSJ-179]MCJ7840808.1 HAD family hydrolase [Lederbergia sp. NSJ-179]